MRSTTLTTRIFNSGKCSRRIETASVATTGKVAAVNRECSLGRPIEVAFCDDAANVNTNLACGRHGRETTIAVDVLAHEAIHLGGSMDEAQTECRSLQTMAWTAQRLGATAEQGHAMALAQYAGAYQDMPVRYRHPGCKDGTALDLRPDDPRFP